MRCPEEDRVSQLLVQGGTPPDDDWLERHLSECPECWARFESQRSLVPGRRVSDDTGPAAVLTSRELSKMDAAVVTALGEVAADWDAHLVFDPPRLDKSLGALGPYDLLERLDRGGFGVVFLAVDASVNRQFAVKVLRPDLSANPAYLDRVYKEAQQSNEARSPYVVSAFRVGRPPEFRYPCLVMDYVEGESLQRFLQRQHAGPVSGKEYRQAAAIVQQVAEGLHAVHEKGVLHRDIKPANILLDRYGVPRLTDFGLALDLAEAQTRSSIWDAGTLAYMGPERFRGGLPDRRSDVYSLGVVLYQLLVGELPFSAKTAEALRRQVLDESPKAPRQWCDSVPRDLETIALKCLAKDPDRRYPTARALADDLGRYLAGQPIQARPVSRAERAWLSCRRNPWPAALGGVLVTAMLLVSGLAVWLGVSLRHESVLRQEADTQRRRVENAYRQRLDSLEFIADRLIAETPVSGVGQEVRLRLEQEFLDHFRSAIAQREDKSTVYYADDCAMYAYYARAFLKLDEARRYYEQAVSIYQSASMRDQASRLNEAKYRINLAHLNQDLDRAQEGYAQMDRAQTLCEACLAEASSREAAELLAGLLRERGVMRHKERAWEQALRDYHLAEKHLRQLLVSSPHDMDLLLSLATLYRNIGNVWDDWGLETDRKEHFEKSEAAFAEAVRIGLPIEKNGQAGVERLNEIAENYNCFAISCKRLEQMDRALQAYQDSARIRRELVQNHPGNEDCLAGLGRTLSNQAILHQARNEIAQARSVFQEVIRLREGLIQLRPDSPDYRRSLANTLVFASESALAARDLEEAQRLAEQAAATARQAMELAPGVISRSRMLVSALGQETKVRIERGDHQAALEKIHEAIQLTGDLAASAEATVKDQMDLAHLHNELAEVLVKLGRREEAASAYGTSAEFWEKLGRPQDLCFAAAGYCHGAELAATGQDTARRQRFAQQAVDALRHAVRAGFRDAEALDEAFDVIRDQPGFQEVLGQLAAP